MKGLAWLGALAGLAAIGLHLSSPADAGGETRTLRLYSVNTKESLTTTYMVNGRHVPSELAKINHLLRDWRRNEVTKMDTETIDLMWELHADLGSRAPIHIISGFRSAQTNALLKKIGRNVAKQSMHIQGKAVDLYFPDVPTERIRNSALVREIGGVGYYPRSGVRGFVHIDSGRVRHWPGIGSSQLAQIKREYRKTVGARLTRDPATLVASAVSNARVAAVEPQPKPAQRIATIKEGYPVPTPRPRPIEVFMLAAAQMTIEPAAAPVPKPNFAAKPSPVKDRLAHLPATAAMLEPQSNIAAKGSFAAALRDGTATGLPLISTVGAAASGGAEVDMLFWPTQLMRSVESLIRFEGSPQAVETDSGPMPAKLTSGAFPQVTEEDALELSMMVAALKSSVDPAVQPASFTATAAKGDLLMVNRSGKADLISTAPPPRYAIQKVTETAEMAKSKLVETFESLLGADEEQ